MENEGIRKWKVRPKHRFQWLLFLFLLRFITSWSYVGINVWKSQGIA
jgi:hypothetical protein